MFRATLRGSLWMLAVVTLHAAALPMSPALAQAIVGDTVVLQGLDKVTARISTFESRIGDGARFGTLEIYPRYCQRTPPEEPPESVAFLDVYEARPGEERSGLFHGWMFASSPALSALEHPVYDVWVLECKVTQSAPEAPDLGSGDKR